MREMQKQSNTAFYVLLSLPAMAMAFALCVQLSAVSWLLAAKYHLDLHDTGVVWLAGPVGAILAGLLSDRLGRRRPFIIAAGALAALMLFLLQRLDQLGGALPMTATLVTLTLNLAIHVGLTAARALIADTTASGAARTWAYSWMQAIGGLAGVVAYAIGAVIDNEVLIGAGVLIAFVCTVAPMFFVTEPGAAAAAGATDWRQLWRVWLAHGLAWLGVQTVFMAITGFIMQRIIAPGQSPEEVAAQSAHVGDIAFVLMNLVAFALPLLVLAPLAARIGRVRTQAGCIAVMAVVCFAIAFMANSPHRMYALMALAGIGLGAMLSLPFAIMSEQVDRRRMGFFMGMFNLTIVAPQLLASGVGQLLTNAANKNLVFIVGGSCLAVSAILWLRVRERAA